MLRYTPKSKLKVEPFKKIESRTFHQIVAASKLRLLHRLVPPPSTSLAGVGRGGEPDLWMEISIKVIFFKD
jgi:hypothetical protein